MISKMLKNLYGDKYTNRSGRVRRFSSANTRAKKLFKQRVVATLSMRNWISKQVGSDFKSLNKSINSFRNIKVEKAKNYINIQKKGKSAKPIKIAKTAKDIIPEFLGKAPNLDQSKEFFNPNIGKNKKENIAQGNFGVVQHAYAKRKNKHQNMSRLFVKKKMKTKQASDILYENQTNKAAGIASKIDPKDLSVVTEYEGETLENLFTAEQQSTKTITTATMKKDGAKRSMIYNRKKMSFETKIDLARQLLTEISKLHKKGIIHKDIKPSNLLVNSKGKLSIIDFGIIADVGSGPDPDTALVSVGTHMPSLAPPEVSFSPFVNNRYDSWSAGEVIYELFTGKSFLENVHHPETWNEQKRHALTQNIGDNLANNPNLPQEAKTLIYALLAPDPEERISVTESLQFSLFTNQESYGKPSLIALSTQHDEKFKELAGLENELTKTGITESKRQELKAKIKDVGSVLKKLQEEINKF